jgi:hypothetical protein
MPCEFINADLEITSNEDLAPISAAFAQLGDRFFELHCGEMDAGVFFARFEIHLEPLVFRPELHTAEAMIGGFCDSIAELPESAREIWDRAQKRVIDLGYASADHCPVFHDFLSAPLLHRMQALGIDLALSIYPKTIG